MEPLNQWGLQSVDQEAMAPSLNLVNAILSHFNS
jgi:hypothetical protein